MCQGYFCVVFSSSEGAGIWDWMFRQGVLFLQPEIGTFYNIQDYDTSESLNILRTVKIKSKSFLILIVNEKAIGNRHLTNIFSCLLHIAIS